VTLVTSSAEFIAHTKSDSRFYQPCVIQISADLLSFDKIGRFYCSSVIGFRVSGGSLTLKAL